MWTTLIIQQQRRITITDELNLGFSTTWSERSDIIRLIQYILLDLGHNLAIKKVFLFHFFSVRTYGHSITTPLIFYFSKFSRSFLKGQNHFNNTNFKFPSTIKKKYPLHQILSTINCKINLGVFSHKSRITHPLLIFKQLVTISTKPFFTKTSLSTTIISHVFAIIPNISQSNGTWWKPSFPSPNTNGSQSCFWWEFCPLPFSPKGPKFVCVIKWWK